MSNTTTSETVRSFMLGGWGENPKDLGIPQRAFGELVKLALPVVEHYHSDLYHDAIWLQDNITDTSDVTFYYVVRSNGTHLINQTGSWLDAVTLNWPEAKVYSVAITVKDRGRWDMHISEWVR